MCRSEVALVRRLAELDARPWVGERWIRGVTSDAEPDAGVRLGRFLSVMCRVPGALVEVEEISEPKIDAVRADDLVAGSSLLTEIDRFAPDMVAGPMDRTRQHWITTDKPLRSKLPNWNGDPPSARRFVVPQVDHPARIKPFGVGMWTSTACVAETSMWKAYLEPSKKSGGGAWSTPWHTWALFIEDDVKIAEITSATTWVKFVRAYPRICEGRLYPDWVKVARDFDAVHMTLSAIAAVQGFNFSTPDGVIPAESWDVESTFWLKWRFSGARLVEKVGR